MTLAHGHQDIPIDCPKRTSDLLSSYLLPHTGSRPPAPSPSVPPSPLAPFASSRCQIQPHPHEWLRVPSQRPGAAIDPAVSKGCASPRSFSLQPNLINDNSRCFLCGMCVDTRLGDELLCWFLLSAITTLGDNLSYSLVKPILEKCSAGQLLKLEESSPVRPEISGHQDSGLTFSHSTYRMTPLVGNWLPYDF